MRIGGSDTTMALRDSSQPTMSSLTNLVSTKVARCVRNSWLCKTRRMLLPRPAEVFI